MAPRAPHPAAAGCPRSCPKPAPDPVPSGRSEFSKHAQYLEAEVFPKLAPHQRVLLVPVNTTACQRLSSLAMRVHSDDAVVQGTFVCTYGSGAAMSLS